MGLESDTALLSRTTLRLLLHEEISRGFSEFREGVRESFRRTLQEELHRVGSNQSAKPVDVQAHADNLHALVGATQAWALPGSIDAEVPQPPNARHSRRASDCSTTSSVSTVTTATVEHVSALSSIEFHCPSSVCTCGNMFKDDALFCRKCGASRPIGRTDRCICGNIFAGDAVFCRTCGEKRPTEKPTDSTELAATSLQKKKKKKKRKFNKSLFTPMNQLSGEVTALQRLTTHRGYEFVSAALIVVNAVFLGWQTQFLAEYNREHALRNEPIPEEPIIFYVVHFIFCVCFSVELGLRWKAEGFCEFFKSVEAAWNILDVVVVVVGIMELIMDFISLTTATTQSEFLSGVSVLRVLRILRVVRIARVIRVMKFFKELRVMVYSILGCVKNLLWVLVVLLLTFYIFGVGFTSAVTDYLNTSEKWKDESNADLVKFFGTIGKSLLTLFMAMSGGDDWRVYYDAVEVLGIPYAIAFLMFIVFSLFAVVNIVTGVFVESALESNIKDRDIVVSEELHMKKEYLKSMEDIFEEMDEDGLGTISLHEFEHKLKDERVIAYFRALKLDVTDAAVLFGLLDTDRSNEISIKEFLDGCYNLQGESRSLDVKIMQYEVRFLKERFEDFDGMLNEVVTKLNSVAKMFRAPKQKPQVGFLTVANEN